MDISHEEFITILKEKDRYEMKKNNLRNKNGASYEIMRFNTYIKVKYYWVFCINKKNIFFFGGGINSEILLSILCWQKKIFFWVLYK